MSFKKLTEKQSELYLRKIFKKDQYFISVIDKIEENLFFEIVLKCY